LTGEDFVRRRGHLSEVARAHGPAKRSSEYRNLGARLVPEWPLLCAILPLTRPVWKGSSGSSWTSSPSRPRMAGICAHLPLPEQRWRSVHGFGRRCEKVGATLEIVRVLPRIARARRLAILMHAVLRNKTEFAQVQAINRQTGDRIELPQGSDARGSGQMTAPILLLRPMTGRQHLPPSRPAPSRIKRQPRRERRHPKASISRRDSPSTRLTH
jgi:hypothetical protein